MTMTLQIHKESSPAYQTVAVGSTGPESMAPDVQPPSPPEVVRLRDLAAAIKNAAGKVGFDLVGIADIAASDHADYLRNWFGQGRHGTMDYLARMLPAKMDIRTHLPWAASAICVAMSYYQGDAGESTLSTNGSSADSADRDMPTAFSRTGKIASYAAGRDYHRIFTGMLRRLETEVRQLVPEDIMARAYVDTGPCLERELAARAGLGWIGKNTMLIHPRHGSWFLLGELFLSLPLVAESSMPDHCGTCTRCIDACPTDALSPYKMAAEKCISYLTLENRGTIASEFHAPMQAAGYLVGCDICQSVCPFNRRPLAASHPDFQPRAISSAVSPRAVLQWTEHDWDQATRGRAFRRAKLPMWKRNAAILLCGAGNASRGDQAEIR